MPHKTDLDNNPRPRSRSHNVASPRPTNIVLPPLTFEQYFQRMDWKLECMERARAGGKPAMFPGKPAYGKGTGKAVDAEAAKEADRKKLEMGVSKWVRVPDDGDEEEGEMGMGDEELALTLEEMQLTLGEKIWLRKEMAKEGLKKGWIRVVRKAEGAVDVVECLARR
ncbi:hypothetical protein M011DRAFT_466248 [Sporormia fimetaria CBS 119925]|uniref:Uncharacterized protein n=1 Tax=Sporormia fimetaria CBS 119925 TaxID=1340428 RepID=A0A6A6VEV2_9PLEO|nr:hypothetical protein M011DRAFT_466248 [Sporormia fimetaria CBS 119925]